eukprot:CAMPEP_0175151812 /NCGR_PEP_ID=MMETSP0087-20121206/18738_1 /TAXON_ID=136419 /ORGANISM="Unknown Unknown, Strain D1" /LENGTH=621 /DNA_ID=CAMNT_0016438119 /DNA_START=73 /DNA_END=1938 /DNA_ORIENTATION=+
MHNDELPRFSAATSETGNVCGDAPKIVLTNFTSVTSDTIITKWDKVCNGIAGTEGEIQSVKVFNHVDGTLNTLAATYEEVTINGLNAGTTYSWKVFPQSYGMAGPYAETNQYTVPSAAATASPTAAAARRLLSTQSATASSRQTVGPRRRLLSESPTVAPTPNVGKTSPYVSAVSATGFRVAYYKPADTKGKFRCIVSKPCEEGKAPDADMIANKKQCDGTTDAICTTLDHDLTDINAFETYLSKSGTLCEGITMMESYDVFCGAEDGTAVSKAVNIRLATPTFDVNREMKVEPTSNARLYLSGTSFPAMLPGKISLSVPNCTVQDKVFLFRDYTSAWVDGLDLTHCNGPITATIHLQKMDPDQTANAGKTTDDILLAKYVAATVGPKDPSRCAVSSCGECSSASCFWNSASGTCGRFCAYGSNCARYSNQCDSSTIDTSALVEHPRIVGKNGRCICPNNLYVQTGTTYAFADNLPECCKTSSLPAADVAKKSTPGTSCDTHKDCATCTAAPFCLWHTGHKACVDQGSKNQVWNGAGGALDENGKSTQTELSRTHAWQLVKHCDGRLYGDYTTVSDKYYAIDNSPDAVAARIASSIPQVQDTSNLVAPRVETFAFSAKRPF